MSGGSQTFKLLPPVEELRRFLIYDPETGLFLWKFRNHKQFDSRLGGKPAFVTSINGYRAATLPSFGRAMAHRVAFKMVHGRDPIGEVDHINGNRSDNRIANLREVSSSENKRNAARPRHNTSGITGVSYRRDKRKWRAFICLANDTKHLGYFSTKEGAIAARKSAEAANGFHPNHGRAR